MSLARSVAARLAAGVLVAFAIAACSEELGVPGDCPDLCPNASLPVYDTTITAIVGQDSTYVGYVAKGTNTAILVTTPAWPVQDSRGFYLFARRADSVSVNDTLRPYTIDSVAFLIGVVGRDSSVRNLQVELYKLAPGIDTSLTFPEFDALLTPESRITSVPVGDSLRTGIARVVITGDSLQRVALSPADSGVLRLGLGLTGDAATGIRLGALSSGTLTSFYLTYVTSIVADTAVHSVISRGVLLPSFIARAPYPPPPGFGRLVVGGAPSARTLLRFELPAVIRDSATIVRARLELEPLEPVRGLPFDDALLEATGVLIDVGAKSPLITGLVLSDTVQAGQTSTLEIEVRRIVQQWQAGINRPPAIFLSMNPEASTFTLPIIASSIDTARSPRIRIAYVRRYPFVNP
jgi:hypothetical protein